MAKKKKKRQKRNTKPRRVNYNGVDKHHICWTRRSWNSGYVMELRLHPYCVVLIPRDTLHHLIHSEMKCIPPPSNRNAKTALFHLNILSQAGAISYDDPIEKRLKILIALFDCIEQPTADAFREQLRIVCEYKNPL